METLQAAAEAAGYFAPKPEGTGRGVALAFRGPGGGESGAKLTLTAQGDVIVETPVFDQGTGTYTLLCQVVGEELGVDPRAIEIEVWNTDVIPFDSGVAGSRATRVNTTVAFEAAQATKRELTKLAARLLDSPEDTLTVAGDQVRRPDIEEAIGWRELLARAGLLLRLGAGGGGLLLVVVVRRRTAFFRTGREGDQRT